MRGTFLGTKTISIEVDVYDRLKALKTHESESFSLVLRRLLPEKRVTFADIRRMIENGAYPHMGLSEEDLERLEEAQGTVSKGQI